MNTVVLSGRLCNEPEVKQGQSGTAVARYRLAVSRYKSEEADFINCVAFGKSAEFVGGYLHKGMKIMVSGRIQTGSYTNKEGQKVYTTDVIVENHEFCESKGASTPNNADSGGFKAVPAEVEEELPFK